MRFVGGRAGAANYRTLDMGWGLLLAPRRRVVKNAAATAAAASEGDVLVVLRVWWLVGGGLDRRWAGMCVNNRQLTSLLGCYEMRMRAFLCVSFLVLDHNPRPGTLCPSSTPPIEDDGRPNSYHTSGIIRLTETTERRAHYTLWHLDRIQGLLPQSC